MSTHQRVFIAVQHGCYAKCQRASLLHFISRGYEDLADAPKILQLGWSALVWAALRCFMISTQLVIGRGD